MIFLNAIKYFMTKNKQNNKQPQTSSNNGFNDSFNYKLINNNNNNNDFNQNKFHTNSTIQNNFLSNKYFHPNETYKQKQLNNMKMLHENNITIRPTRINLNNQYNHYANNNKHKYQINNKEILNETKFQIVSDYVRPHYNYNIKQNYSHPIKQRILSRKIKQYPLIYNHDQYLYEKQIQTQYHNKKNINYQNKLDNFFNNDNIYTDKYRQHYKQHIANSYNKLQFNKKFNYFSEQTYDGKNYYYKRNSYKYFNDNRMAANLMSRSPSYYQNNNFAHMSSTQFDISNLTNNIKNNNYDYKSKLSKKQCNNKFNKEYINKLIPLEVIHEIRFEKVSNFIIIVISLLGIIITNLFIALYFISNQRKLDEIIKIQTKYIPHPFLTIIFLLISLGLLFSGIFNLSRVRIDINSYLTNLMRGNRVLPHFLINNYNKITIRSIILN